MTREELIEKYRDVHVEHHDWWEPVYALMHEKLEAAGIWVDNFYWTGFWSQGDGACFEGHIANAKLFFDKHFTEEQYPWVKHLVDMGGKVYVTAQQRGRYYHEHSVTYDESHDEFQQISLTDPLSMEAAAAWDEKLIVEMDDFFDDAREVFRGYMKELYSKLQKEHDYLTSDEAVSEYIDDYNLEEAA